MEESKVIKFNTEDEVICINIDPITIHDKYNEIAPPLELKKKYTINRIILDDRMNQHLDVGLESEFATIRSVETGQFLEQGDEIHWCHPSRFKPV